MAKKQSKNLQKVQDMLDDKFDRKIQSGYTVVEETHKVGDIWTDSDGREWEQKNGYRVKISKMGNVGIFSKTCKDCGKNCTSEQRHLDTWNRFDRCFHCQINFEVDLKAKGKWMDWVVEQEKMRWESIIDEMNLLDKENKENKWNDKSVANALSNDNVKVTIKKNTK